MKFCGIACVATIVVLSNFTTPPAAPAVTPGTTATCVTDPSTGTVHDPEMDSAHPADDPDGVAWEATTTRPPTGVTTSPARAYGCNSTRIEPADPDTDSRFTRDPTCHPQPLPTAIHPPTR